MSIVCESFSEEKDHRCDQDPPVFGRDIQKVDGSGQCYVFILSVFQSAWTTLLTLS